MTTTLTSHWEAIAQLLFAVLIQWMPRELATVLAMLWPMFALLLILAVVGGLLAWQDRRELNRRVHRRVAQLRGDRRDR